MNNDISRIDLIVEAIPPTHDAIGEYTACLATELAAQLDVSIVTSSDSAAEAIEGVAIDACFQLSAKGNRFSGLYDRLLSTKAEALVVQYNPFAWGKRGYAPDFISTLQKVRKARPDLSIATMFHETFVPPIGLRYRLMRCWQLPQYKRMNSLSNISFFSVGKWAEDELRRRPNANAVHLAVGSSLPESRADRTATRGRFGIQADALVLGVFGGAHVARQFDWIRAAATHLIGKLTHRRVVLFHIGGESESVATLLGNTALVQTGRLDARSAADAIAATDIMLNPFVDGISTRRTSTISALQQGVAVVTTTGHHTDPLWSCPEASGISLVPVGNLAAWLEEIEQLAKNHQRQREAGQKNKEFFLKTFSWKVVANKLLLQLSRHKRQSRNPLKNF